MIVQPTDNMAVQTKAARKAAAKRMRRCRARRRAGYRCLTIEVDELVHRGLLGVDELEDPEAIATALYEYLEASIGRPS